MTKNEARFGGMVESFLRYNDPHEPWPMILVRFAAHRRPFILQWPIPTTRPTSPSGTS